MGTLFVDKLDPQSGTSLEIGSSGDTITIPSGCTITNSGSASGFGGLTNWSESSGNLLPSNASYGIYLGTTSANSSSDPANLLNDYEQGTYTPVVTAESGTITSYSINNATYTKVGRQVQVNVYFNVSNNGSGSGKVRCTLPFTTNSNNASAGGGREIGHTTKGISTQAGGNTNFVSICFSGDGSYPTAGGYNFFTHNYIV